MSKYHILFDYGTEGFRFWNEDGYDTINEAVREAISVRSGSPFQIVQIVDWEAVVYAPEEVKER